MKGGRSSSTAVTSSTSSSVPNENTILDENSSETLKTTPPSRKSLIPLLTEKSTPTRQALTPIQKTGTPKGNQMVGRETVLSGNKKVTVGKQKFVDTPRPALNKSVTNSKCRSGALVSVKVSKHAQAGNSEIDLVTGDVAPMTYWKELAESRRQALEETLKENQTLHERVEELTKENQILEELVDHAKNLAEIINSLSEDENPDESGIGKDSDTSECSHEPSSSESS